MHVATNVEKGSRFIDTDIWTNKKWNKEEGKIKLDKIERFRHLCERNKGEI
jgi:hypothetical protein